MACTRYDVISTSAAPGFVEYVQCDTLTTVTRTVNPGNAILLDDVEEILRSVNVTVEVLDTGGGGTDGGGGTGGGGGASGFAGVEITLGFTPLVNSAQACFRFSNNDPTLDRRTLYINANQLSDATRIATDPTGFNAVPNGTYTDGDHYITVQNGSITLSNPCRGELGLVPITLCVGTSPTGGQIDIDNLCEDCSNNRASRRSYFIDNASFANATAIYSDIEGKDLVTNAAFVDPETQTFRTVNSSGALGLSTKCATVLQPDYYQLRSCDDSNELIYTVRRPSNDVPIVSDLAGERVTYNNKDYIYTGVVGGKFTGTPIPPDQIQGSRARGCVVDEIETVFLLQPCSTGAEPKYTQIINSDNTQVSVDGNLYYYNGVVIKPSIRHDDVSASRLQLTGRTGCNTGGGGGGGTGGPPPAPTTVIKRLFQTVSPSLRNAFNAQCAIENLNEGAFVPGGIRVNGQLVGQGDVTYTFTIGEEYRIEFELPSHPSFSFSIGNSDVVFTATTDNSPIEAVAVPTFIPSSAVLNVTTSYSPSAQPGTGKGGIILSGVGKIGTGEVRGYELTEGSYTISFEPIQVAGMIFVTPPDQTITITSNDFCRTFNITGNYRGVPLPKGYWLKEIDGSEQGKSRTIFTKGMFSNNIGNLTRFFTGSISDSLDNHYTHVYHEPSGSATASIQFSLAYGNYNGSGSNDLGGQYMDTPTRAIYGQYRSILTEGANKINLTGTDTDHFYVLSFQKGRKDTLADYAAFEINLAHLSGSEFINGIGSMATHTGSNVTLGGQPGARKVLRLISDHKVNEDPDINPLAYNIVSGSIEDGVYNSGSLHYYGKLYPTLGAVLLDANKLDASASFGTVTSREVDGKNQLKLFTAISGAGHLTDTSGDYLGMKARTTDEELIMHYFINVRNREFNLSNNSTYFNNEGLQYLKYGIPPNVRVSGDVLDNTGIVKEEFQLKPKTYITTIGLYNQHRELLAVGKISKPDIKSFTDEVMYTVRIKY